MEGSFGGSLNIINGGLECPPDPSGYHAKAIVTRLRYYCIAASVVGVKQLLNMDGCEGLNEAFEECIMVCGKVMVSFFFDCLAHIASNCSSPQYLVPFHHKQTGKIDWLLPRMQ